MHPWRRRILLMVYIVVGLSRLVSPPGWANAKGEPPPARHYVLPGLMPGTENLSEEPPAYWYFHMPVDDFGYWEWVPGNTDNPPELKYAPGTPMNPPPPPPEDIVIYYYYFEGQWYPLPNC